MTARHLLDRIAGPLVLLATLAIALMYWQGRHVEGENAARDRAATERIAAVVDCQAKFNQVIVANIQIRDALRTPRDLAAEAVFARIGAIVKAAQEGRGPEQLTAEYARFRVAFAAYDVAIRRLNAYKKANPIPPFPACDTRAGQAAAATASPTPSSATR